MSELEKLKAAVSESIDGFDWLGFKHEGFEVVAIEQGEDRRWSRTNDSIAKAPSGQLFALNWEQGLTENQFDCECEPNVRPVTAVTRMVEVTTYE